MKALHALLSFAASVFAGCATVSKREFTSSAAERQPAADQSAVPQERGPEGRPRGSKSDTAPLTLTAYEVRESAFSDFGMSVKTNFGVRWGGNVEWMVVSALEAGSSAAHMGITVGDRILAIDGHHVQDFDRDAMLDALFQRKKGERSRMLVLGHRQALPRFVTLVANRPEIQTLGNP